MKQRILIAGGHSGIGRAIAHAFHRAGHQIIVVDINAPESTSGGIWSMTTDISVPDHIAQTFATVDEMIGGIDGIINCAGIQLSDHELEIQPIHHRNDMVNVNIHGLLNLIRCGIPRLKENSGFFFQICDAEHANTTCGAGVYNATQSAVVSIVKSLRDETMADGIRVSRINVGLTSTEFHSNRFAGNHKKIESHLLGVRMLKPTEIADVVLQLANMPYTVNIDSIDVLPAYQSTTGKKTRYPVEPERKRQKWINNEPLVPLTFNTIPVPQKEPNIKIDAKQERLRHQPTAAK